jgi:hypothetical protein
MRRNSSFGICQMIEKGCRWVTQRLPFIFEVESKGYFPVEYFPVEEWKGQA